MAYRKLRGRIKEYFNTQSAFADKMGMDRSMISQRLQGKTEWKTVEIVKACELLEIPLSEAYIYFFTEKV